MAENIEKIIKKVLQWLAHRTQLTIKNYKQIYKKNNDKINKTKRSKKIVGSHPKKKAWFKNREVRKFYYEILAISITFHIKHFVIISQEKGFVIISQEKGLI